jgi:anaerobic magnesium-protoporphyrin IX monomethyl ester cyclase
MKIFFIYPDSGSQVGFNYGLSHISSVLKGAGHKVAFWQLCEDLEPLPDREQFIDRIKKESPGLIGFSVVTNQWNYTKQLASWIKGDTDTPIVCGGIHALLCDREILQAGLFDYVFRGECENAFLDFVEKLSSGKSVDDVSNLSFLRKGHIKINPLGPLPDIQRLPFKDYSIMDFQKLIDAKKGWVGLMASRGCPFACTYCFNHKMVAAYKNDLKCSFQQLNYIRRFKVEQVIDEIKFLLKNYRRITEFIFDDDIFTFDKSYIKEFSLFYKQTCDLPFVVNAHFSFFDNELASDLKSANCKIVKFGVESGSEKIRKTILNRYMSNDSIIQAIRLVNEAGMHSSVFIIIGFPYEKKEDVLDTIRLLAQARPGRFRWTYFFPFPGTKAHQFALEGGFIDEQKQQQLQNFTDESCLDFGAEHNLLLKKVGRVMPWFVNAYSDLPVADFYRGKINEILKLDEAQWNQISPDLHNQDKKYSQDFSQKGLSHYAIKYNPFMGVISDYFLQDLSP